SGTESSSPPGPVVAATTAPPATTSQPPTTSATPTTTPTTTTPRPTRTQPVVPGGLVGQDVDAAEELLKELGYRGEKVALDSTARKDSVIATVPGEGRPLSPGQTVVLVVSKGDVDRRGAGFVVPDGLVGMRARDVERQLRGEAKVSTM